MWTDLKIVYGKPRHSQSQGSVERANQDIENMLSSWLENNERNKWSEGLRFIQFAKNRAYHSGIKCSPYEAMFGVSAKIGLKTSSPPNDVLKIISTEEGLEELVEQIVGNQSSPDCVEHEEAEVDELNELLLEQIPEQPSVNEPNVIPEEPASNEITERQDSVAIKRTHAKKGLEEQAKKMLKTSNVRFPPGNVGDTVKLRVPDVERARSDYAERFPVLLDMCEVEAV
ncbi:KRAB-A domain-containing protein 2-like [Photinus pyralis]|uniref:KRAB-A domain-containing protein 2-like n=1 Tax=Photinus pyralis TaxID=7054 RepID=UPI0012671D45|nr:KRAB-A domain-containing protein 2-like [Photinus pyralis]